MAQHRFHEVMGQRPWIGLLVAAPIALVILGFAIDQYQRARAFGDEPRRVSVAEALSAVEAGAEPWVELTDMGFDCARSVAFSGSRHGRLTLGEHHVPVIASISGSACPAAGTPMVGVLTRLDERFASRLRTGGLPDVTPADASLSTDDGPANSRTGAIVLSVLAACCLFLGSMGYIIRHSTRQIGRDTTEAQRHAVLTALERPPLRLRPAYVFKLMSTAALLAALELFLVALAIASAVWIAQIAGERSRFDGARDMVVIAEPAVEIDPRFPLVPSLVPTITITWQSSIENEESVQYHPLWAGAIERTIVVRADAQGPLTSAGLELRNRRIVMWGLAIVFAVAATPLFLRSLLRTRARWRSLQRASEAPLLVFLPLVDTELKHQNGIPVGMVCKVRDAGGQLHSEFFSADHAPLRNGKGDELLAVVPRDEPRAIPVFIAEDGYPFKIDGP